jgi:hypothetical protein
MKKIAVISFDPDIDVTTGMQALGVKYPEAKFLIAIDEYGDYAKSAVKSAMEFGDFHLYFSEEASIEEPVHKDQITFSSDPVKDITRELSSNDVLAVVWDESLDIHEVVHSLEDFAIDMWDISDGLDQIELDYESDDETEELYDVMTTSMAIFAESLAAYVTSAVLDVLTETIRERMAEDDDTRGIDL